eukprot:s2786_g2.t1
MAPPPAGVAIATWDPTLRFDRRNIPPVDPNNPPTWEGFIENYSELAKTYRREIPILAAQQREELKNFWQDWYNEIVEAVEHYSQFFCCPTWFVLATLSGPLGVAEPWAVQLFERSQGSPGSRGSRGSPVLLGEEKPLMAQLGKDFCLTIEELHFRSQRLAWRISSEGIEESEFVAVCMPRGPGLVVALLGVWRAGKAYVPLEPSFPPQRLRFMLEDSQAQLLLASAELEVPTPMLRLCPHVASFP